MSFVGTERDLGTRLFYLKQQSHAQIILLEHLPNIEFWLGVISKAISSSMVRIHSW